MSRGSRLMAAVAAAGIAASVGAGSAGGATAHVSAKVADHRLVVTSLKGNSHITLRLRPGHPLQLAVDADGDGDTDFLFARTRFRAIVVNGRGGKDVVRIDESRGVFTTTERTTVVGGSGDDTLRVDGSSAKESFDLSASGPRLRLRRGAAAVALEAGSVELLDLRTGGGADTVTENALAGTPVANVRVDVGRDTKADKVTVPGTDGADTATLGKTSVGVRATGLSAPLVVKNGRSSDTLTLAGLGGSDTFNASGLSGALSVVVDGGTHFDTLRVSGSAASNSLTLSAGALGRLLVRGATKVDAPGVEEVDLLPLGGADALTVNDLSGTAVTSVDIDLGPADGQANQVTLNATNGDDIASIAGDADGLSVLGLAAQVALSNPAPDDRLRVNVLAGDDVIDASSLSAGALSLTEDGGDGGDVLLGSAGADVIFGGAGDDVLVGGPGVDILDGGPGDNVVIQD